MPQSPFTGQFFLDDNILHCLLWVLSFYDLSRCSCVQAVLQFCTLHIWQRRLLTKTVCRAGCWISKSFIILYLQVQINAIKFILGSTLGQGEKSKVGCWIRRVFVLCLKKKPQQPRFSVSRIFINLTLNPDSNPLRTKIWGKFSCYAVINSQTIFTRVLHAPGTPSRRLSEHCCNCYGLKTLIFRLPIRRPLSSHFG
jgi:hypothetical protein